MYVFHDLRKVRQVPTMHRHVIAQLDKEERLLYPLSPTRDVRWAEALLYSFPQRMTRLLRIQQCHGGQRHGGIKMERHRVVNLRYSGGGDPLCTLLRAEGLYGRVD